VGLLSSPWQHTLCLLQPLETSSQPLACQLQTVYTTLWSEHTKFALNEARENILKTLLTIMFWNYDMCKMFYSASLCIIIEIKTEIFFIRSEIFLCFLSITTIMTRNASTGHRCPHKYAEHRIELWLPSVTLTLNLRGINILMCASSQADKFLIIEVYGCIIITFWVTRDTKFGLQTR